MGVASVLALALATGTTASAVTNTSNARILGRVRDSGKPVTVIMSRDGRTAYVVTQGGPDGNLGALDVIDVATGTLSATIKVGDDPLFVRVTNDGRKAYVSREVDSLIDVVDIPNRKVLSEIDGCDLPFDMAMSSDSTTLYATCSDGDSIAVIDTATDTITNEILVGTDPWDAVLSPSGKTLYVANHESNSISLVDTRSQTERSTFKLPADVNGPISLSISPDGRRLYAIRWSGEPLAIDTKTKRVIGKLPDAAEIAVSRPGKRLYLATSVGISVVDAANNRSLGTIPVQGRMVSSLALTPDSTTAYAATDSRYAYIMDVSKFNGR
jgi:YVTN family beta-propeller protein